VIKGHICPRVTVLGALRGWIKSLSCRGTRPRHRQCQTPRHDSKQEVTECYVFALIGVGSTGFWND
jgi:hypothetical protein